MKTIADKKVLVKANAAKLNVKVSEVNKMDEPTLDALIAQLDPAGDDEQPAAVISTDSKAFESTYTTEKGEIVPIVNGVFTRLTANGAFEFQFGGSRIITTDSDLRVLHAKGGLAVGDQVAFKPDTLDFRAEINGYYGQINKSATPKIMMVVNYRTENKAINNALQAEFQAQGMSINDAKSRVQDEIVRTTLAAVKRPTLSFDK